MPPLPDKKILSKLKIDTLNQEFLETRRIMLNIFLTKMSQHPELMHSDELRAFLTEHCQMFDKSKNSYLSPTPESGVINQTLSLCQSYFRSVSTSP